MAIDGEALEQLTRACAGTLNDFELEVVVHVVTGDQLYEAYVGRDLPLRRKIRELLNQLDKDGSLPRLLAEIMRRKPERPDLPPVFGRFVPSAMTTDPASGPALSLQHSGTPDAGATAFAAAPGLQRNVRPHLAMLEVREWLEGLARIEKQVCRIDIGTDGMGTGFLVGPSVVMTNWHVVRQVLEPTEWKRISCRFDHLKLPGGAVQGGTVVPLGKKGVITFSRSSKAELTPRPDSEPPMQDELDYALLHLAEPVGTPRGWVSLPEAAAELAAGSPLIIAQHPLTAPMKLALDTDGIIGRVGNGMRLRYHTNTEPGSSGSPCFDMDWRLVALHHLGDPISGPPAFNQGVPAELILSDIEKKGLALHLAAAA